MCHFNVLAAARSTGTRAIVNPGDPIISYLPYTHSYEQGMMAFSIFRGMKIGYYQGDPLKIAEDCSRLRPVLFPSVPRLYNKIYTALNQRFSQLTGCKRWLLNRGLAAKRYNLEETGAVRHYCYDTLIFGKASAMLGGQVR